MSARLPSPPEVETVKYWLMDSTKLHVDGCAFRRHGAGLALKVEYRDLKGNVETKQIVAPDTDDFTELAVEMSNWLEYMHFSRKPKLVRQ